MLFFFKPRAAYEVSALLVGSEMWIRDKLIRAPIIPLKGAQIGPKIAAKARVRTFTLYQSDAPAKLPWVILVCRRVFKKKIKQHIQHGHAIHTQNTMT